MDLDVIMVLQSVLHVVQEGEDIDPVQATVQQSVHALERSLPQVQTIIHSVFERTHLHLCTCARTHTVRPLLVYCDPEIKKMARGVGTHLSDQLLPHFGLVVQLR